MLSIFQRSLPEKTKTLINVVDATVVTTMHARAEALQKIGIQLPTEAIFQLRNDPSIEAKVYVRSLAPEIWCIRMYLQYWQQQSSKANNIAIINQTVNEYLNAPCIGSNPVQGIIMGRPHVIEPCNQSGKIDHPLLLENTIPAYARNTPCFIVDFDCIFLGSNMAPPNVCSIVFSAQTDNDDGQYRRCMINKLNKWMDDIAEQQPSVVMQETFWQWLDEQEKPKPKITYQLVSRGCGT